MELLGSEKEALLDTLVPPPSFDEVMSQILREAAEDSMANDGSVESDLFQQAFGKAKETGLLDSYQAMQSYVNDNDNVSENVRNDMTRCLSSFLKTLGSRYVGRVALWLYERLQRTAERVMTHPQDPWPVERLKATPSRARRTPPSPSETAALFQVKRSLSKKPQVLADNSPPYIAIKKPETPKKRKSTSDSENSENAVYECKIHKKQFTGKFAYDSYQRHLKHTKQHGTLPFTCHICRQGLARIDHFKAHMLKAHAMLVDGRAGDYTFRRVDGPVGAVPELDAARGTIQDGGQDWRGYVAVAVGS